MEIRKSFLPSSTRLFTRCHFLSYYIMEIPCVYDKHFHKSIAEEMAGNGNKCSNTQQYPQANINLRNCYGRISKTNQWQTLILTTLEVLNLKRNFHSLHVPFSSNAVINSSIRIWKPGICEEMIINQSLATKGGKGSLRPDFLYFMVYRHFWAVFNVGIQNKNKILWCQMSFWYQISLYCYEKYQFFPFLACRQ